MYEAAQRGDVVAVWAAQARLNALLRLRGRAPIHTYKVLAQEMGLMGDTVASPLPRMTRTETRQCLAAHGALTGECGSP